MRALRFCLYQYAHHPLPVLEERWRRAEELGFDVLWNCDTLNEPDHPGMPHFEATSILAAMALRTSRIRVGTLVTSLVLREPAMVAKAAMTIDHLSGGRLELGFGGGAMEADHDAVGEPWWPAPERVARFAEAVRIVDGMLTHDVFSSEGTYHSARDAEMVPRPVQRPRPPLTVAAHGPSMLRIAAEMADAWSSWGGADIESEERVLALTRERAARLEDICAQVGRDPATIRRSLVVYPPLTPWESVGYFRDMVGRLVQAGIDEFVLYWPREWRDARHEDAVFEEVCADVIPELRG